MLFGLFNSSSSILSILLTSRTLGKKLTKPKSNNPDKFSSNALKIVKAPTMIVFSTTSRLMTALIPAKNSATTTRLLTILPPIPITTNAIANEFKTKSRPNVQAALRLLVFSILV